MKKKCRTEIIQALLDKKLDVKSASKKLAISERQVYRLLAQARKQGTPSLLHGNTGKTPHNKIEPEVWEKIVALTRGFYSELNDRELQRALKRDYGINVGRESLRKQLRAAGIPPKIKRHKTRRQAHLSRKQSA